MATTEPIPAVEPLRTLPGDEVRAILWRYADRYDLAMVVQAARAVARGPIARLVAAGERNNHDWTPAKHAILRECDNAGITTAYLEPEEGGYIEGPKNLVLSLIAFELAWVDGGAATGSLASCLALAPIHERGTPEQKQHYMSLVAPKDGAEPKRGAFCLTEPIPFVGVETGMLSGKIRIAEWPEGGEPVIEVNKRGRFITNMGFANFVTAAVDTDDPRIASSCMVILEESDGGIFDRGTPTKKLVHQLSSTSDPSFQMKVPASRIIGGYRVEDGKIVPNYSHGEVIEAVFRRTRVMVGLITSAKLLSAVEPLIRYHRDRFRGSGMVAPGSPRYELGLQQKEDVTHRLLDIWATGEAASSLGFAAARLFDELDPLEKEKDRILAAEGIRGGMAVMKMFKKRTAEALAYIEQNEKQSGAQADPLIRYMVLDAVANVICPAVKLWNTGHGSQVMREAVSLMGGYGITEDCPGFLGQKWMDSQLEATYEGPEAVQRRHLTITMTNEVFLAQFRVWIRELRRIASDRPGTGACALATAMELWQWTLNYLLKAKDPEGGKLYQSARHGVTFPLADALCWLLASRQQILDVIELEKNGGHIEGIVGTARFLGDLCHIQAARAAGEASRICAELVFGYRRHPAWADKDNCRCYREQELMDLEAMVPGASSFPVDILREDGGHPEKAGPCVSLEGLGDFMRLRSKVDGCLAGSMLAKDRAAQSLTTVMIPAALDYPA